jgi:hypothetical protein
VNVIDPVTLVRLQTVLASGFRNETELADAILRFVSEIGQDLLDGGALSDEQAFGVKLTLNDTPLAFATLAAAMTSLPLPGEQKANLVFMLARLIDDMMSLGAVAITAGNEDIALRVLKGAGRGGRGSTDTRRRKRREWQDQAITVAKEIVGKNKTLTQDDLATIIEKRWHSSWPRLRGRKSVINLISEAQKDGRLPRRPQ